MKLLTYEQYKMLPLSKQIEHQTEMWSQSIPTECLYLFLQYVNQGEAFQVAASRARWEVLKV